MPDPNAPASATETACLELLSDTLDGDDAVRIEHVLKLCLTEPDAVRSAGAQRLAETSETLKVYLS